MAYEDPGKRITLPAAADLSTKQYFFIKLDANGRAALASVADEKVIGVLQNKPDAIDKPAEIMVDGVSKFVGSATLAPATVISTDAAGKGKAAAALAHTAGTVIVNPGADGQLGSILLQISHVAAS